MCMCMCMCMYVYIYILLLLLLLSLLLLLLLSLSSLLLSLLSSLLLRRHQSGGPLPGASGLRPALAAACGPGVEGGCNVLWFTIVVICYAMIWHPMIILYYSIT